MICNYYPEGSLITTPKNCRILSSETLLEEAAAKGEIIEARALSCDAAHNLLVDLGSIKGIIPRCDGAIGINDGSVRDIALISRVGKPVSFIIEGFSRDGSGTKVAVLSRRRAQEECIGNYISRLRSGDIVKARVTHLESFGAFCDIGCGCIALLPIDSISVSRISHPGDRCRCGDEITAVIKSNDCGRITQSMKELLGTWQENADCFCAGETVSGIIRSVESYGIFVELAPNLAGLAELRSNVSAGEWASVYIKSILPDKMKVKLIIIDSFDGGDRLMPIKQFYKGDHIDKWHYSPDCCPKAVGTVFE